MIRWVWVMEFSSHWLSNPNIAKLVLLVCPIFGTVLSYFLDNFVETDDSNKIVVTMT